ncbi:GNAT family N-acetyltransferase [Mucilaginibacter sp. cycad4]|uniref:GNAT family N-acetyltransferase n=1 Tax=Mucilaginibacter sp. cycad4 TaxID=3342096 RepID=UPI002AABB2F4|nr:GNAT family N-acetyltransferase [Mucilaginibacter gossypii]WPU98536.1 GNAT family N-acetyltransferase [Mucilaginibacter gossypii]
MITIRKATVADRDPVWQIIREVISGGDTYVFDPASPKEKMLAYWFDPEKHTYVAVDNDDVAGTFVIRDNQPDLGAHVANGAYMISSKAAGRGIGKLMGEYSLQEAKHLGYKAMQFNFVVKSNRRAVQLWQKLGFDIIGEIPDAFNHQQNGFTNAYIMYRKL